VENIPEEVIHIIREVDDSLKTLFPQRYYSLDIGKGNDGSYKIFELNANPMLSTPSIRKHLAEYIQETYLKDTTFSL
jgi:glutathione synthase/RimK-type ligase-like ATP-grasp enzyme